jgi:DNA-binding LacI/PurR family transcriptional regulator
MNEERVTIAEIARLSGVSPKTAGLALRGDPSVSLETSRRVRDIASRTHYKRREEATTLLGVITPQFNQPFYIGFYQTIQSFVSRHGYLLSIVQYGDVRDEPTLIRELDRTHVEGILLLSPSSPAVRFEPLLTAQRPVVAVNSSLSPRRGLACIGVDNSKGTREALEHLLVLGHKRIAYLGGPTTSGSNIARKGVYEEFLSQRGLFDYRLLSEVDGPLPVEQFEYGYARTRRLWDEIQTERPTAIFAYNDLFALGAMRAIKDLGLELGHQVSVIGFDNLEQSRFSIPRLSTVSVPRHELATNAVRKLVELIEAGPDGGEYTKLVLSTDFLPRESIGPPAG